MEVLFDEPIKSKEQDLLNRQEFAKRFAECLVDMPEDKTFTVSLNGCWGSGKTSLINMIKEELKSMISKKYHFLSYPIIVDYYPWNTLDENGIISQFFEQLISTFSTSKVNKIINSKIFKDIVGVAEKVPKIGKAIEQTHKLLKKYAESFLSGDANLLEIKNKISKKLKSSHMKYIVFIDDIDRLNNKEIKLLIQLIKAVCDFPNIIYVLSFDKNIVANALSNEQMINGYEYLEKIIQLSIDVPEITQEDLQKYLFNRLDKLIVNLPSKKFDTTRWGYIFRAGYFNYFKTIRNINRYINLLEFKYNNYVKVLDVIDYIAMEAVSLFEPDLIQIIKQNKDLLCYRKSTYNEEKTINDFKNKVESVSNNYEMLSFIFPVLSKNSLFSYNDGLSSSQRKAFGRLCFDDHFDYYFSGHLSKGGVCKDDVEFLLNAGDLDAIENYFKTLNNKSFNMFLQYLCGFSELDGNIDKVLSLLTSVIEISKKFENLTRIFSSNEGWLSLIIDKIIEKKGLEFSFEWIREIFESSSNFNFLISLLYHFARNTNLYYFNSNPGDGTFDNEKILKLHETLIERLKLKIYQEDIFDNDELVYIINFISIKNKDILDEWYKFVLKNDKLLSVIDKLIYISYGESTTRFRTYKFNHSVFDGFVNIENVRKKVLEYTKNDNNEFSIGKILFLMPEVEEYYTLKDVRIFCEENGIKFDYEDKFIDE